MLNPIDRDMIRPLAERYAEIANLDVQQERLDRYRRTNALERVRPVLLVDEVPWGEIQDEALNLLDPAQILVHSTVAATDALPADDFAGKVRRKDVWGRCAAQIFGSVSPDMHDVFDLAYNQQTFGGCGLL